MVETLPQRIHSRARWHGYDEGLFFITCCSYRHRHYFGKIENEKMILSECGKMLDSEINAISDRCQDAKIHCFTVMPNHFHLIVEIKGAVSDYFEQPTRIFGGRQPRLSTLIGSLKSGVSRKTPFMPKPLWQKGFHDHVIRTFEEYLTICDYIDNNPANWRKDCFLQGM